MSLMKALSMKVGVYLMFTGPTYVAKELKVKSKKQ